jgi:hypothetical protein
LWDRRSSPNTFVLTYRGTLVREHLRELPTPRAITTDGAAKQACRHHLRAAPSVTGIP